ncbi:MAG: MFS transporter [Eubacteriaceae bacterium]
MKQQKVSMLSLLAIFMVFLLQGGGGGLNPAVNGIAEGLNMDPAVVTQVGTFPAIFIVIVSLFAGRYVGDKFKYKTVLLVAIIFYGLGGALPLFIHSWTAVMISRACVGIGVGAFYPLAPALILKLYEGAKQGNMMGIGNAVATAGGIVTQLLSGLLVDINWTYAFGVHLIGIISLVFVAIGLSEPEKEENIEKQEKVKIKLPARVYVNNSIILLFMMLSLPLILSLSVIIVDRGFGTGLVAGTAMSMFTIGGTVWSLIFGPLYKTFKRFTTVLVLLVCTLGMVVVYYAANLAMIFVGMFIVGMGLLIVPSLMMDNNKLITPDSITFSSSMVVVFMYIGNFLASYFLIVVGNIASNLNVAYPALFISVLLMAAMTILWFMVRWKQGEPESQEQ